MDTLKTELINQEDILKIQHDDNSGTPNMNIKIHKTKNRRQKYINQHEESKPDIFKKSNTLK